MNNVANKPIERAVCKALGICKHDLTGEDKKWINVEARQILFKILTDNGMKPAPIGKLYNRDRSNINYSIKQYEAKVETKDKTFLAKIEAVTLALKQHESTT